MASLNIDQKVTATVKFFDRLRNPVAAPAVPTWSVGDASLLSVTPSEDGMSAVLVPLGPLGHTTVSALALSIGATSEDIEVLAGPAVSASVELGAPEAQTEAATAVVEISNPEAQA